MPYCLTNGVQFSRAEGLFCFVGMQGEAQKGEGAPVLFTPVFYRAACVRQYTA